MNSPLASSITKLGYIRFVVPKEPLPVMAGERPRCPNTPAGGLS